MTSWEQRYAIDDYLFGTRPSDLLQQHRALLRPGMRALAVADGEGRNGVWLAKQGLDVTSIDISPSAVDKAERLASRHGLYVKALCGDIETWQWPVGEFDVVVSIFLHLPLPQRHKLHNCMLAALKPGGLLLLEAYHQKHLLCDAGGPQDETLLYTEEELAEAFADMQILHNQCTPTLVEQLGQATQNGLTVQFVGRKKLNP